MAHTRVQVTDTVVCHFLQRLSLVSLHVGVALLLLRFQLVVDLLLLKLILHLSILKGAALLALYYWLQIGE